MHEYILSNHDRRGTYYMVAVAAGALGVCVTLLTTKVSSFTGNIIAAPSGIGIFYLTFLIFDLYIWKIPFLYNVGIIKIPNLNGKWDAQIRPSINSNGIEAAITIHQTYTKLRIRLETEKSYSLSKMAVIEMADPTCFKLRYEYLAEFHKDMSTVVRHHGVTDFYLKSDDAKFNGEYRASYYTELLRDTHGEIIMKRKVAHA